MTTQFNWSETDYASSASHDGVEILVTRNSLVGNNIYFTIEMRESESGRFEHVLHDDGRPRTFAKRNDAKAFAEGMLT